VIWCLHLTAGHESEQAWQRGADGAVAQRRHEPGAAAAHKPADDPLAFERPGREGAHQVRQLGHCRVEKAWL